MAIKIKTGINPLDFNKNKAIGVAFPFDHLVYLDNPLKKKTQ